MTHSPSMIASCACGSVELRAFGRPIASAACYCDDCQKGAAQIETLPNAPAVRDSDGGTAYILYRTDRFECSKGAELLRPYKLRETSRTNRVVATCCNSAMFMSFDKGLHWVSTYRARFHGELPPLQYRICTKFKPDGVVLPNDVPISRGFAAGFAAKLLASRIAMALRR
ncbi:GFA family protein [Bradyrhizobium ganzhouense]|uniref:GFA family protein n=1 Tax=Bradyrhizobium ganzhouense TaxID=1179767 RepID=UPI003CF00B22